MTGSPKCSFKNPLNLPFYCSLKAAALKMAFLLAFLCGHTGQSLMEADAAAIKGNSTSPGKFNNFVYTGVNIAMLLQ